MFDNENKQQRFEEKLLTKVAMAGVVEQRRGRRLKFVMFLMALAYIPFVALVIPMLSKDINGLSALTEDHIAVVEVKGVIAPESEASASIVVTGLRDALESENSKAVILRINSPGGSPVQSDLIYKEILRLRLLYPEKPIYSVIEDIGASGAYYIAAATENIYASESSIVGSIGVTSGGSFGFVEVLEKLGVERRIYTSGENKAFLDPFLPEKASDKQRYESMLKNVHKQFIAAVEGERKERIKPGADVFNGYVWTGEESLELGLIDAYGSVGSVSRDVLHVEELVNYTPRADFLSRFAKQIGVSAADTLMKTLLPAPSFK